MSFPESGRVMAPASTENMKKGLDFTCGQPLRMIYYSSSNVMSDLYDPVFSSPSPSVWEGLAAGQLILI